MATAIVAKSRKLFVDPKAKETVSKDLLERLPLARS